MGNDSSALRNNMNYWGRSRRIYISLVVLISAINILVWEINMNRFINDIRIVQKMAIIKCIDLMNDSTIFCAIFLKQTFSKHIKLDLYLFNTNRY